MIKDKVRLIQYQCTITCVYDDDYDLSCLTVLQNMIT